MIFKFSALQRPTSWRSGRVLNLGKFHSWRGHKFFFFSSPFLRLPSVYIISLTVCRTFPVFNRAVFYFIGSLPYVRCTSFENLRDSSISGLSKFESTRVTWIKFTTDQLRGRVTNRIYPQLSNYLLNAVEITYKYSSSIRSSNKDKNKRKAISWTSINRNRWM